jgi:hypothetical protein
MEEAMDGMNDVSKIKSKTGECVHIEHHGVDGCAYIHGGVVVATLSHIGHEWVLHRGTQGTDVLWRRAINSARDIGWDCEIAIEDAFVALDRDLLELR